MKTISSVLRLGGIFFAALIASAQSETSPLDYWIYRRSKSGVEIFYDGRPIKFNPDVGDGAFDRAIEVNPERRFVFLDAGLTLDEAAAIVAYWKSHDPKTPTDFVVILNDKLQYRFLSRFERVEVPVALVEAIKRTVGTEAKTTGPTEKP